MTIEKDYKSTIVRQGGEDNSTVIYLNDLIPNGFLGDSVEIEGKEYKIRYDDNCGYLMFRDAVLIDGKGDFVGKEIRIDKSYFKR